MSGIQELKSYIIKNIKAPSQSPFLENKSFQTIMLYGPPGNGKTLMAESIARLLDATFYICN